jgi:protein involved in polysaccharide export with SLBB domain
MFRFVISLLFLVCLFSVTLHGQQLPSNIDFSTVNVDNLSDQQLQQMLQKAQASGLGVDEVVQQAQAKGMPADQVSKLRDRLNQLGSGSANQPQSKNGSNNNGDFSRKYNYKPLSPKDSVEALKKQENDRIRKKIFGSELFSNSNLTFEPNLNIPTPGNYVIGAGDEIIVDVFGYSEKTERLKVTPDGSINVSNVGPIIVSGLTMDEARVRITHKLTSIYSDITSGKTHVQVLLGDIRSIRVMIIGEIMRPGSYTLPSLATVANALYVSGGPDLNGSFRDILVIRNGKAITTFDLYDFLEHGSLENNVLLQDQDIIKVNPYKNRIELSGEVKHPAIFEAKEGETLANMIGYAGGFTSKAYKDFIRAIRITDKEKEILTVQKAEFKDYKLHSGDSFHIDSILDRYTNRMVISGSVFHPGDFALEPGMTLKDLIGKADGVTEDAFLSRGIIKRLKPDFSPEILNFNVQDILSGASSMPVLREDSIFIFSKFKIREPFYVIVRGEVNHPDTIPYADSMHLQDAILLAGGMKDAASLNQIEIGRRVSSQQYDPNDTVLAIVQRFSTQRDLSEDSGASSFTLKPFDQIMIRHAPGYHELVVVQAEGEVVYPGSYIIDAKNERLSDLVRKAGGLKSEAFSQGAFLLRRASKDLAEASFEQSKVDVFAEANQGNDSAEVRKIRSRMDSTMQLVGINLEKALESPRSKFDLLLQSGDVIRIPMQLETVTLYGEVFYPKQVRFDNRYRFKDFISQAGGFTGNALRRRSYVVYPNGEVASTRKVLFFNHFPKVKPGAEVFVPARKPRVGLSAGEIIGMSSSLVAILAILLTVIK